MPTGEVSGTIERAPSLTDRVVEAIRDGIRARRFVPGEIYSAYQLADELGVSRSPVRDALLKLAEAGLVVFSRNRGFEVVLPRPRDVAAIFAVRLALEPPAARRVAEVGTDDQVAALGSCLRGVRRAARARDEQTFWALDRELHDLVLRGSGNDRAADIVASLRATTALLGAPTSATGRSLRAIADEHAPVVTAVAARDGGAAEAAMRTHLVRTGRLLVAQVAGVGVDSPEAVAAWESVVGT